MQLRLGAFRGLRSESTGLKQEWVHDDGHHSGGMMRWWASCLGEVRERPGRVLQVTCTSMRETSRIIVDRIVMCSSVLRLGTAGDEA